MEFKGTTEGALKILALKGMEPQWGIVSITCDGLANHMVTYAYKLHIQQSAIFDEMLEALEHCQLMISRISNIGGGRSIGKSMIMKQFLENEKAINKSKGL